MAKLSPLAEKEQDIAVGNTLGDHGVSNRHAASKLRVQCIAVSRYTPRHDTVKKTDVCPKQGFEDNGRGFHAVTS